MATPRYKATGGHAMYRLPTQDVSEDGPWGYRVIWTHDPIWGDYKYAIQAVHSSKHQITIDPTLLINSDVNPVLRTNMTLNEAQATLKLLGIDPFTAQDITL